MVAVPAVEEQVLPIDHQALNASITVFDTDTGLEGENAPKTIIGGQNPTSVEVVAFLKEVFGDRLTPFFYQLILCESSGNPNAIHHNKNGTTDYNLLQINDSHDKELIELGLDYKNNWRDNIRAAKVIFDTKMDDGQVIGVRAWTCKSRL